jgi:amidohydrolase
MNEEEDFVLVQHHDAILPSEPKYMSEITDFIKSITDDLSAINTKIHDNPEVGYEEHKAHALLTNFLKSRQDWKVTTSAYGIDTAWVAVYDSGKRGPVVSFNVEMDALPGLGHACGHNLIATSSLAAALATASVMRRHSLRGKIVLFGTPAEEGGGGKIRLLRAGAYKNNGVDISLISHPGITHDGALTCTSAFTSFRCEYFGKASHAARSPWLGINALDALIIAYNALSVLRQQTMPGDVIQGHITDGGLAPNIIHAYAAGTFVVRANTAPRLEELRRKVDACFRAGAEATGARLKVTEVMTYLDHVPNRVLGASYTRYWNSLNPPSRIQPDRITRVSASTDQGDVSHVLPSLSVSFAVPPGPEGMGPHSPEFEKVAGTKKAFGRCLRVGEALAGTAVDVLFVPGLLEKVKEQWKKDMAATDGSVASL